MSDVLPGPVADFIGEEIKWKASEALRRYPLVELSDLEQAMWTHVYANTAKYCKLFEDNRLGIISEELRRAGGKLAREDDRYRRAVKASAEGYSPDDEHFYTPGMLRLLLPVLIEAEWDVAEAVAKATQAEDAAGVFIRMSSPEDAAGNYTAMLLDVRDGMARLSRSDQVTLRAYYGVGQDDSPSGDAARQQLAESMGLTGDALRSRAYRARQRLAHRLGGATPWRRKDEADATAQVAAAVSGS